MGAKAVYKGAAATSQAIHEHTQRMYPLDGVICERCMERPATDRHHIDNNPLNNLRSNIEFLCHNCHSRETSNRRWQNGKGVMARVIKYGDTSKIEGAGKQAPVGLHVLKCEKLEQKKSKNDEDMVEVIFKPVKDANGKKHKVAYANLYFYAPLDTDASWARRLKDLITAFGLKEKGGNLSVIVGKECMGRLREDTDLDGEYRPNIGKLLPLKASDEDEEPDEEEDEDLEEEEEDEEPEADEEEDDGLDDMERADLKAHIKSEGLEVKVLKSMSDDDIRAAIRELTVEEEEEEDEEPDDNYDSMSLKDLKQECEDRELETKGRKPVLIARLRTDDQEEPV